MTTTMTITNPDWTIVDTAIGFEDSETPEVAREAAETVHAWLINHTHRNLAGWSYTDGSFTGPARADALDVVGGLIVEANDYAIENMAEIKDMASQH